MMLNNKINYIVLLILTFLYSLSLNAQFSVDSINYNSIRSVKIYYYNFDIKLFFESSETPDYLRARYDTYLDVRKNASNTMFMRKISGFYNKAISLKKNSDRSFGLPRLLIEFEFLCTRDNKIICIFSSKACVLQDFTNANGEIEYCNFDNKILCELFDILPLRQPMCFECP